MVFPGIGTVVNVIAVLLGSSRLGCAFWSDLLAPRGTIIDSGLEPTKGPACDCCSIHSSWVLLGCRSALSARTARCGSVLSLGLRRQDGSGWQTSSLAKRVPTD